MSPDDVRHGSYAGAIKHWRDDETLCEPCLIAARRRRKKNHLDAIAGRPAMTTLGPAHRVILTMPRNQLVAATGIAHRRMQGYAVGGPDTRVHRRTRDRILAAARPTWTPVGIQRRLQALTALGWSMQALADRAGVAATSLGKLRRRENPKHVRIHFAEAILDLYADLAMQIPPAGISAAETRSEAARRGYAPPLAWDDTTIDDPAAHPASGRWDRARTRDEVDPVIVDRVLAYDFTVKTTVAEKAEVVRRWVELGRPLADLERAGWRPDRYLAREVAA